MAVHDENFRKIHQPLVLEYILFKTLQWFLFLFLFFIEILVDLN